LLLALVPPRLAYKLKLANRNLYKLVGVSRQELKKREPQLRKSPSLGKLQF